MTTAFFAYDMMMNGMRDTEERERKLMEPRTNLQWEPLEYAPSASGGVTFPCSYHKVHNCKDCAIDSLVDEIVELELEISRLKRKIKKLKKK